MNKNYFWEIIQFTWNKLLPIVGMGNGKRVSPETCRNANNVGMTSCSIQILGVKRKGGLFQE